MSAKKEVIEAMDVETSRKRKGGAIGETSPILKRQNSCPNIRESTLTSVVSESLKTSEGSTNANVGELIVRSFKDKSFIEKITPVLSTVFQPLITAAINEAVLKAVSGVEKGIIGSLKRENQELKSKINTVERAVKLSETELKGKDKEISDLQKELESLSLKVDSLDQYGRRLSVRLVNMKMPNGQDCESTVIDFVNKVLEVPLSSDEIERCHPLGNQVIVKFKSYKTKAAVFKAKAKLKRNPDKVFMTEDLTKRNHTIVKKLLELRKSKQIEGFWTQDAKIFLKVAGNSSPFRVTSLSEIDLIPLLLSSPTPLPFPVLTDETS